MVPAAGSVESGLCAWVLPISTLYIQVLHCLHLFHLGDCVRGHFSKCQLKYHLKSLSYIPSSQSLGYLVPTMFSPQELVLGTFPDNYTPGPTP